MSGVSAQHANDIMDAQVSKQLSMRMYEARKMRGMTLKALAEASGCSNSLISKIENGKAHPSLLVLNRIARALNVSMSWIFDGLNGDDSVIAHAQEQVTMSSCNRAVTMKQVLHDDMTAMLQCHLVHIETGGECEAGQQSAGEEVGYILEGVLELTIDGRSHRLNVGDAFVLQADRLHSFRNAGTTRISFLSIRTMIAGRGTREIPARTRRVRPWIFASPRSEMMFRAGAQSRLDE